MLVLLQKKYKSRGGRFFPHEDYSAGSKAAPQGKTLGGYNIKKGGTPASEDILLK
jgi:hypothetical protein